jgi:hypothetical protein
MVQCGRRMQRAADCCKSSRKREAELAGVWETLSLSLCSTTHVAASRRAYAPWYHLDCCAVAAIGWLFIDLKTA